MGRNRGMGYDRFATIRLGYKPLYILYIYMMYWSAIHLRRRFADHLRRKHTPAFLPITCNEESSKAP